MYKNIRRILEKNKEIFILNKDGWVVKIPISYKSVLDQYADRKTIGKQPPKIIKELSDLGMLCFQDYNPRDKEINYDDALIKAQGERPVYDAPIIVHLAITNFCNLQCRYCSVRQLHKKNSDELTTPKFKKIIRKLSDWGVYQIGLTGGEPTLRKDLVELAGCISSSGVAGNLTTNGWLVNKKLARELFKVGIEQIQISLDSHKKEIHELYRNKGSYERALKAIEILKEAGMKVGIDCVVSKDNLKDIPKFIEFLSKRKISGLTLIKLKQGDLPLNVFKKLIPDYRDYSKLIDRICWRENIIPEVTIDCASVANLQYSLTKKEEKQLHSAGCPAGHTLISIAPNGDVYPCAALTSKQYKLGNILSDSLKKIWHDNKVLKNLRNIKNLIVGDCRDCERLDSCRGGCRGIAKSFGGDIYKSDFSCDRVKGGEKL